MLPSFLEFVLLRLQEGNAALAKIKITDTHLHYSLDTPPGASSTPHLRSASTRCRRVQTWFAQKRGPLSGPSSRLHKMCHRHLGSHSTSGLLRPAVCGVGFLRKLSQSSCIFSPCHLSYPCVGPSSEDLGRKEQQPGWTMQLRPCLIHWAQWAECKGRPAC